MKIVSKKGIELEIVASGYRTKPKLSISFSAGGNKVKSDAKIVRNDKIVEGLAFTFGGQDGRIECTVAEIELLIAELPEVPTITKKTIEIKKDKVDSDGYEIEIDKYILKTIYSDGTEKINSEPSNPDLPDGRWIYWTQFSDFLKKEKIQSIEFDLGLNLYVEKHPRNIEKEARRGFDNIFNDDLAEEGIDQALENAGISKLLR